RTPGYNSSRSAGSTHEEHDNSRAWRGQGSPAPIPTPHGRTTLLLASATPDSPPNLERQTGARFDRATADVAMSQQDGAPSAGTRMNAERFDALASGRRRGPAASLLRGGLWLASLGYGVGVRLRNAAYSRGWSRVTRASVPVVSVGNLTVGGTGKT